MSVPFPPPQTWRDRLRWPVRFLAVWLVMQGGIYALDAWDAAALRRRAAPYLEAANPLRRQLGLVSISARFKPPRYVDRSGDDGTDLVVYSPQPSPDAYVFNEGKALTIDVDTGALTTEEDTFWFTDPDTTARNTPRYYFLRWEYLFAEAAARRPPWRIRLSDRDLDVVESGSRIPVNTLHLTRAQADSVLRSWRLVGQRDSLARLARSGK